ncbi:MAG: hypothetical protein M3120_06155 [Pseudomonadota bacterium]|nr:hypothetical protein [Pseudomonadota bacterium]
MIQDPDGIKVCLVAKMDAERLSACVQRWFETGLAKHWLGLLPLKISIDQRLAGDYATMGKYRPIECRLPRGDAMGLGIRFDERASASKFRQHKEMPMEAHVNHQQIVRWLAAMRFRLLPHARWNLHYFIPSACRAFHVY